MDLTINIVQFCLKFPAELNFIGVISRWSVKVAFRVIGNTM